MNPTAAIRPTPDAGGARVLLPSVAVGGWSIPGRLRGRGRARSRRGTLVQVSARCRTASRSTRAGPRQGFEVEGRLAALIGGDAFPENVGRRVVAEERFNRSHTTLPPVVISVRSRA